MSGVTFPMLTDKELDVLILWGSLVAALAPSEQALLTRLRDLRRGVACPPPGACSGARCSVPRTNALRTEAWGHGEANST